MLNNGCSPVSCTHHNIMQKEVAEKETEARNKRKVQEIAGTAKDEAAARAIKATQEYEKAFARANPGAAAMVTIASLKGLLCSMTGSFSLLHISRIATLCTQACSLHRSSAGLFIYPLIHCARSPHQGPLCKVAAQVCTLSSIVQHIALVMQAQGACWALHASEKQLRPCDSACRQGGRLQLLSMTRR